MFNKALYVTCEKTHGKSGHTVEVRYTLYKDMVY